jgi:4-carboxymuconolactone decarboxylase
MQNQDLSAVSPALLRYETEVLFQRVWTRPGLSPRDRNIVTLAALITRDQTGPLTFYTARALDNGVTPREVSEILTHLAFYAGWGNALSTARAIGAVFSARGIGVDQLPLAAPELLPLDQTAEDRRKKIVNKSVGTASPGLVEDTGAVLFRDLWLRPDLAPRDRSMVTVAALITSGQFAQVAFHLGKAMDNGLTAAEASELISHIAYYAGWPNAFSAVPVVKAVLEARSKAA